MKVFRIVLLILCILTVFCLGILFFAMARGFDFPRSVSGGQETVLLDKTYASSSEFVLNFEMANGDVEIRPSDDDRVRVVYKGPSSLKKDPDLTVTEDAGGITIRQKTLDISNLFSFFRVSFIPRGVTVYVPEKDLATIRLQNSSGNLTVVGDYSLDKVSVHLSSGDIRLPAIETRDLSIETSSGNISVQSLTCDTYSFSSSSGDMDLGDVSGDGSVNATSGNIRADEVNGHANIQVTSGEITLADFIGQGSVRCISGRISVRIKSLTGDLSLSSTSGDIGITTESQAAFNYTASVTSGDVSVAGGTGTISGNDYAKGAVGANPTYLLTADATSGNITIAGK